MVKAIKKRVPPAEASPSGLDVLPSEADGPITLEQLTFLSASARRALNLLAGSMSKGADGSADESALVEDAFDLLKRDLEGQPVASLELCLDWLREVGLYQLSLELLEEAWSAELPLELLGRVAQDWLGTVLFGLNDEEGARVVARHITPRAFELGASFCGDLCDVLLEWGLHEEATPLARFVVESQPGDTSARFHLGVCAKLSGDWSLARESFAEVLRLHPEDKASLWNQGLVAVAERQWTVARQAWGALGFSLPEGEGDYASAGELSPVRLSCRATVDGESVSDRAQTALSPAPRVSSEVLWGVRLCPARVKLTGIPYHHPSYRCGDVLLIDGVKAGEVSHQGQRFPVSPVIGRFMEAQGETLDLIGPPRAEVEEEALSRAVESLSAEGWTLALWTRRFPRHVGTRGALLTQLSVYLPPGREARSLSEALAREGVYQPSSEALSACALYHERWATLLGEDPSQHRARRAELLAGAGA